MHRNSLHPADPSCRFENDVNMYGTQAPGSVNAEEHRFENDVNMYGTQNVLQPMRGAWMFENDVNV